MKFTDKIDISHLSDVEIKCSNCGQAETTKISSLNRTPNCKFYQFPQAVCCECGFIGSYTIKNPKN